ncbi:MAG: tetratricopeptide repeat protein [Nitrospirae bacterium]|nr:tetratricopeptide repeat protein [Nitrospirota bacterium]
MLTGQKTVLLAKITRPKLSGIFGRDRLFRLIDKGRNRPVVWIAAQAGSGKTTLVASYLDSRKLPCLWYQMDEGDGDIASFFYYMGMAAKKAAPRHRKPLPLLTSEYLMGIPVFTRHYFEELFCRLKSPAVIVLDNYQDAPLDSDFHDMLVNGIDVIPEGITVLVLSRVDPPPQLARLQANNRLRLIGEDEVRFTREESGELLKTQGQGQITGKALDLLYRKTEGWAAGLVLLMAGAGRAGPGYQSPEDASSANLFDYFANEIFIKADTATQDVLLKTSFLQRINTSDAEQLTENEMAGQVLERLSRHHYFTQKYDRAYQYHPLFREFLQNSAKRIFSETDRTRIQVKAAGLLEKSGRVEEAIGLYIESLDWGQTERLILSQAPALVSQGRSATLEGWLKSFPQEHIDKAPWLLYWSGICRMAFDPYDSRRLLEKSFERFMADKDRTGTFLSWASIVDTFVYAWGDFSPLDRWIAVMEEFLAEQPEFPSPEIEVRVAGCMLSAMANRQPGRAGLAHWAERVQGIVVTSNNVQLKLMLGSQLIFYYLWVGDFSKIVFVVEALRPSGSLKEYDPLTRQNWYAWKAMYSWFVADWAACWQAISDGIKNAEDSGIHLLDLFLLAQGVFGGLSLGDPSAAVSCLEKMALTNSPRPGDKGLYQYQAASVAWYYGEYKKSMVHGNLGIELCEKLGWPISMVLCLIEHAVTLFDDNRHDEADDCLAKALEICRGMNGLEFLAYINGARFAFDRGDGKQGLAFLEQGMALGARFGYLNLPRWNDGNMSRLCAKALEHGIEPEYVQKLIGLRGLIPERQVEDWPYSMKVYALGNFKLYKDDKPVEFAGKVQKKPLEMLKALIALGGKGVSEERLIDLLWPDADADSAHKSHEITLLRLRRLLDVEGAIQFKGGLVTLDPRYCWVDVWALEDIFSKTATAWKTANISGTSKEIAAETIRLTEKAIEMYKGDFLESDAHQAWAAPLREKMKSRIVFLLLALGNHWERSGQWNKALEYFQKGLDRDDLTEEFYQHLMVCHEMLGQKAEAVKVYKKCSSVLSSALGISPSEKTEEIYSRLTKTR